MILEGLLYESIIGMIGPILAGLLIFVFFLALGIILKLEPEALIAEMIGALFLVFAFIPELRLIAGVGMGVLVGLGLLALVRR